jgi:hypothetical protein
MILRRRTILPIPLPLRPITKQEKTAGPSNSVAAEGKESTKNVKLDVRSSVRKGSARAALMVCIKPL